LENFNVKAASDTKRIEELNHETTRKDFDSFSCRFVVISSRAKSSLIFQPRIFADDADKSKKIFILLIRVIRENPRLNFFKIILLMCLNFSGINRNAA